MKMAIFNFLRFCKISFTNLVRSFLTFIYTRDLNISLGTTLVVINRAKTINFYINLMKSKGVEIAILCDTLESKHIVEQGMHYKLIPIDTLIIYKNIDPPLKSKKNMHYSSDWTKQIQGIVVPRIFISDDRCLHEIYSDLKMRGDKVAIVDQGGCSYWEFEITRLYKYRELVYTLTKQTVIPSYYDNSPFIDYLLNMISHRRSVKVMDICAGQGCIGFSLFKESNNVDFVLSVEINKQQIKAMNSTIVANNLDQAKVQTCLSDGLTNIPQDMKFDLITGNPPHQNKKVTSLIEKQGGDMDWNFHKSFFKSAESFLNDDGVICLLENGNPNFSDENFFKELIERVSPNLILYESIYFPGTCWYVIVIGKKSNPATK